MDVQVPSWEAFDEARGNSVVSGHLNDSGSLVLEKHNGELINGGSLNPQFAATAVHTSSFSTDAAGPLFRNPNFTGLPADNAWFAHHSNGITIKVAGAYAINASLDAAHNRYGDIPEFGVALEPYYDLPPVVVKFPYPVPSSMTNVSRLHLMSEYPANTRFYYKAFMNKLDTEPIGASFRGSLQIVKLGNVVTPP